MSDRIEKIVELKAPVEKVWRALTDHTEFSKWFGAELDGPFVPGKTTRGVVNGCGHGSIPLSVEVVKMEKPHLFSYKWHPAAIDPAVDYSQEPLTLVEFRLEPIAAGTRLTVVESGFDAIPVGRRSAAFKMDEAGWGKQIENIQKYVES
ncbi:SRPBCC family protein [soil metagenome]